MVLAVRCFWAAVFSAAVNLTVVALLAPPQFTYRPTVETLSVAEVLPAERAPAADTARAGAVPASPSRELPPVPPLAAEPETAALPAPDLAAAPAVALDLAAPAGAAGIPESGRPGAFDCGPQLREPPDLAAFYPPAARAGGVTGVSTVWLTVDAAGRVAAAEVRESDPPGVFEAAAARLARSLRFVPARRDGRDIAVRTRVKFVWRLD